MAIRGKNVRQWLKSAGSGKKFKDELSKKLGVKYDWKTEKNYIDKNSAEIGVDEFNLRELSEEFLGRDLVSQWHTGPASSSYRSRMAEAAGDKERALFEDVVGVTPSAMQDINAWTATVGGLVQVRLLEGYRNPEFIGDTLVKTIPTRQNGFKMIGIPYPNPNEIDLTAPGVEFPTAGLSQYYVWARDNLTPGAKLALTRQAVVYDLGGEIMDKAESVGKSLQWVREYLIAGGIYGLNTVVPANANVRPSLAATIVNSFRMNATSDSTANPTYQTTAVTTNGNFYNYVNQQALTIADWTSLRTIRNKLNLMRDPVNLLPFNTEIKQILADPYLAPVVQYVRHQLSVMRSTGTPATSPDQGTGSTFPPQLTNGTEGLGHEAQNFDFTLHWSNIFHQVLLDGGVTEANAQVYSVAGDLKEAFGWAQAWDLRVDQANPTDSELLSKNLVAMWVAQWSGQFVVVEPRRVILNTN